MRWPPITDALRHTILEAIAERGPSIPALAQLTGMDPGHLEHLRKNTLRTEWRAAGDSHRARQAAEFETGLRPSGRHIRDTLDLPPRPFAVPKPALAVVQDGRPLTAVVFGDTHYPFQDDAALRVVLGTIRAAKPDVVVHLGDLIDCWQISRFDKDPARLDTLQDNIDAARVLLHQIATVAPKARRVLLEGNHEARLTRAVWGLEGAPRELARLRLFQQAMTWPHLLGLEEIGWEWVGDRQQSKTEVLPKIITKHGSVVRKWSSYTARAEWEKYGKSGISGHTHRLGLFAHRDHNGTAAWIEAGCTCDLEPSYGTDFDWAQGCVVLSWNEDRRLMSEEFVRIRDGAGLWRGKQLS